MALKDADLYSMFFVTVCMIVYGLGLYHTVEIIMHKRLAIPNFFLYVSCFVILGINYMLVYRREKQYEYYERLLSPFIVIAIIILAYVFMGVSGQINRDMLLKR